MLPRSEFITLCLEDAAQAAILFKQLWQSLGLSVDWNLTYSTISESTRKISQNHSFSYIKKATFIANMSLPPIALPAVPPLRKQNWMMHRKPHYSMTLYSKITKAEI